MEVKEKVLIYPYDADFTPILRHRCILEMFEITAVVSPKGWSYEHRDASHGDNGDDMRIIVETDFTKSLEKCETVVIVETDKKLDIHEFVLPRIITAIEKGKNIISLINIDSEDCALINQKCMEHDVYFKCFYNDSNIYDTTDVGIVSRSALPEINTPIIFVSGVSERCNKFEIQLSLREKLQKYGYKVSQIGSRRYCEFLGFHSFPYFMLSNKFLEHQKVQLLRKYICDIESKEKPDVIIFGLPGGIVPLTDYYVNNYSILAYEVLNAFIPDVSVLSVIYENYNSDFYYSIDKTILDRYGVKTDCFNLSNVKVSWPDTFNQKSMMVSSFSSKFLDQEIKKMDIDKLVCNILNPDDAEKMAGYLVDLLADDAVYTV